MKIFFARHGESEANVQRIISNRSLPHPLTELGRRQAGELADALRAAAPVALYTSPVPRARETAEIVSQALGVPAQVTDALREFDCGVAEGRTDEAAWLLHRSALDAWLGRGEWGYRIPEGESFFDVRGRFVPFVQGLIDRYSATGASVALIGHGGLYLCMLPLIAGNVDKEYGFSHGYSHTKPIVVEWRPEGLVCTEWCGQPMESR